MRSLKLKGKVSTYQKRERFVNGLGDEQVLWEHVAVKFDTKNGQTPDSRHRTPEIPNPRFSGNRWGSVKSSL